VRPEATRFWYESSNAHLVLLAPASMPRNMIGSLRHLLVSNSKPV
jgi:hypothetical protein